MADKAKSYTKEYVYLIVSALLSYYLIQLQQPGANDQNMEITFMWNVVKVCRRIEWFFARIGDELYRRIDLELEGRRSV